MTVVDIDGCGYVGYLAIPALSLQLPVMADCDLTRMRIAPCRQFGSTWTDDIVIAGHNYQKHFGEIQTLRAGDAVQFTDMDGNEIAYLVREIRLVNPGDADKAKNSGYDLVLYTCTYGARYRVLVCCSREASGG